MSPLLTALCVALAGGAGSALRHLVDRSLSRHERGGPPWSIVVVNLTGSLALGVLTGLSLRHDWGGPWLTVLAAGLLGGYTTFSTASLDTVQLLLDGRGGTALLHGLGTLLGCTTLAVLAVVLLAG